MEAEYSAERPEQHYSKRWVVSMIRKSAIIVLLFFASVSKTSSEEISLEVFFSPRGGCTAAIVREINTAKQSVRVQAYGFSSDTIAAALIAARNRGVTVVAILDRSNVKAVYSRASIIAKAGITVKIDGKHQIAHNKVIIIDEQKVITGSFNFTDNAENNNAENLVIITDAKAAATFSTNWEAHLIHTVDY